jgi:2-dehydro-3-deoxygluconokinase
MRGLLTIGETMVLVTPETPEPLETATRFRLDVAGAESNVASHLARAGVPAAWASAIGADALGRRLVATLGRRGVDTSLVAVDPAAPTGVFFKDPAGVASGRSGVEPAVTRPRLKTGSAGTRVLYYRRGSAASRLGPAFASTLPLASAPVVHVSGITAALSASCRDLLEEVIAVRARHGLPVSFDVNHRPALWEPADAAPVLLDLARRCDLVFVGRDEAQTLWGTATAADVRALIGAGNRLVVKDGDVGAHAFVGRREDFVPAHRVDVVEPVGAGDAFAAGFLAADLAGKPPDAALERGHRFAVRALATTGDF